MAEPSNPYEAALDAQPAPSDPYSAALNTASADPYGAALDAGPSPDQQLADQNANLASMFKRAQLDAPVDKRAGVLKLTKESGLSSGVVEQNYDAMKGSWAASKFDPAAWRQANPELAKLVLEQPYLGSVVMRDGQLSVVSQLLKNFEEWAHSSPQPTEEQIQEEAYGDPARAEELRQFYSQKLFDVKTPSPQAFVEDLKSQYTRDHPVAAKLIIPIARFLETRQQLDVSKKQFELMTQRMRGADTFELEKQILDAKRQAVQRNYGEGPLGQVGTDIAQGAASSSSVLEDAGIAATIAGLGAAGITYVLTRSPAASGRALLKGASIGGKLGGVVSTFRLEAGDSYGSLETATTDDGKPLEENVKAGTSIIYGALAAGIEFASWGPMFKAMGPLGELLRTGEKKAALAVMVKDAGFRAFAKRIAKRWAAEAAAEGGEEFLQSIAQDLSAYYGTSYQQGTLSTKGGAEFEKATLAGQKAFVGAAGMAPVHLTLGETSNVVARTLTESGTAIADDFATAFQKGASSISQQQVDAIQHIADSPTVHADPAAAASVLEDATAKTGRAVTHAHVDVAGIVKVAEAQKTTPAAIAQQLAGENGPRALQEAIDTGSKLAVPMADYVKVAGQDLAKQLQPYTTVGETLLTPEKLQELEKAQAEAGATEAALRQEFEGLKPPEQLDRTYLDENTKLLNERGWDATPVDPARSYVAEFEIEGKKFINDKHGHAVFDAALRRAAKVLKDAGVTAAQVGGGLRAYTANVEGARELARRMDEALGGSLRVTLGSEKQAARAAGTFAHRSSPPVIELKQGEHEIFSRIEAARDARQEPAAADLASAEKILERAKVQTQDLAAALLETKGASPVQLHESLAKSFKPNEAFATMTRTPEGLMTGEGFRRAQKLAAEGKAPKKPHTAFIDARGFGDLRQYFGDEGVDVIASDFAATFAAVIDQRDDPARLNPKGDEFAAQTNDKKALDRTLRAFATMLKKQVFFEIQPSGRVRVQEGLYFAHEFGKDLHDADGKIAAAKKRQDRSGDVRKPLELSLAEWDEFKRTHDLYRFQDVGAAARARREGGSSSSRSGGAEQAQVAADVAQAQRAMGLQPLFRTAAEAGMTPEQWVRYLKIQEEAFSHASELARLRFVKDRKARSDTQWKQELAKEVLSATREYEELPARKAERFLRGKSAAAAVPVSLDREVVVEMVGEEAAKRIPSRIGGEHPDNVADLFGFATGADMVGALASLKPKAEWVKETAASRMSEKHPSALEDRQQLRDLLAQGLHGAYGERWLLTELKALKDRGFTMAENPEANRAQAVPNVLLGKPEAAAADAKRTAQNIASGRKIGGLNPSVAQFNERAAALEAVEAAAKKNYPLAFVKRLKQLLNMHLYGELVTAKEQRDKFYELAGELTDDKARGRLFKASPAFRDGVDQVLEAIELRPPSAQQGTHASIADVVRELQLDQAGRQSTTNFDEDVIAGLIAQPKPYKDLTIAEMREVDTFLRNVRGTARARTTALKEGKQIDREAAVAELIKEAEANRKHVGPVSSSQSAETLPQALGRMWTEFDGAGMRPERLAMWMGGNDLNSSWFKLVIEPLQEGKYKKAEMMKKTAAPLHKKLESALKDQRFMKKVNGRELFPTHREDLEAPRYAYEIWMMLVHAGTQSSLDRLTQGRGITEQQLRDAVNKHLSKKMVDLAQAVWDANESIWPEAQKLEERQSGVAPPKLELRPFETKWGTLKGGYMAAKYDSRIEQVGEFQAGEALGAVLDQSYVRPGTAKSHLKKRAENFSGALQLEPGLILRVLDQAVHDIAYREPLQSVAGLVWDPKIQSTMRARIGTGRARQFRQWLRDVGTQAGANLNDWWSSIGRVIKKRTVQAALAYRLPTAFGDLPNFLIGARRLGPGAMLGGTVEFFRSPLDAATRAYEQSPELRSRRGEMLERFRADIDLMTKRGGRVRMMADQVDRHGFTIYEWTERLFAIPAWLGAMRKAEKEGLAGDDQVTFADSMVRRMLPAWNPVDQSAIQRNRYLSPFLMFGSWHNVMWNEIRDDIEPVLQALGVADTAKKAAVAIPTVLFMIFSSYVVSELVSGRGPEPGDGDDEAERWLHWFERKMAVGAIMPLPVIGPELGSTIESKALHKRTTPRGGLYTSLINPMIEAGTAMLNGDKSAEDKFFSTMRAIAPLLGKPAYPLTPAKYLFDLSQGNVDARGPGDVIGGTIYGQRENQPENIPTAIQNAISE